MNKDKQKYVILGVLGFAVLGIGAFQFTQMNSAPAPEPTQTKKPTAAEQAAAEEEAAAAATEEMNSKLLASMNLPVRDPFQTGALDMLPSQATPVTTQAGPVRLPGPSTPGSRTHRSAATIPPFRPGSLPGGLPDVQGGPDTKISLLPPQGPQVDAGIGYSLSGVITGHKPAAVLVDRTGNQKLVPLGGQLDGDSKVVGVSEGKVTVERNGKTVTLTMGGKS